ncbi:hypothetical protein JNW98_25795 [Streptomyces sp. SCA2-4]|nr:hypothetical protein [Streptomyces huiliensis]
MGPAAADPGTDPATPPFAVETFEYPNAAQILKEKGIALHKGDGHILLADCNTAQDIRVMTRQTAEGQYCFKVTGTGKTGFLELEIPKVFSIMTGEYAVQANLTSEGKTQTVNVAKNGAEGVGESANPPGKPTVLVKLRVTG